MLELCICAWIPSSFIRSTGCFYFVGALLFCDNLQTDLGALPLGKALLNRDITVCYLFCRAFRSHHMETLINLVSTYFATWRISDLILSNSPQNIMSFGNVLSGKPLYHHYTYILGACIFDVSLNDQTSRNLQRCLFLIPSSNDVHRKVNKYPVNGWYKEDLCYCICGVKTPSMK